MFSCNMFNIAGHTQVIPHEYILMHFPIAYIWGGSRIFAGRGPPLGADPEIWLGVWQWSAPMRAAGGLGPPQEHF
jgi:hypothetical protein